MKGKILGDRYKVIEYLAKGGFGTTYLAEDVHLPGNEKCVVKQLNPSNEDSKSLAIARRLFKTEAFTLNNIGHHDQIPELLAYFEEDEKFYLVQQYIDGQTLEQELAIKSSWSEIEVIKLLLDGLNILEFIHSQGVIHRDVKPDNLIRRHSDQKLVLVDFGTVKEVLAEQADLGQLTVAIGTQGYMPTEQARGKPYPSSDIYALGTIGIQILTGIVPIELAEDDQGELIWQPLIDISSELRQIITQMTRYDVQDRYQLASEVLQALLLIQDKHSVKNQLANYQSHLPGADNSSKVSFAERSVHQSARKSVMKELSNDNIAIKVAPSIANSSKLMVIEEINSLSQSGNPVKSRRRNFLHIGIGIIILLTTLVAIGLNLYLTSEPSPLPLFKNLVTPKEDDAETDKTPRLEQGGGFRQDL